MNILSYLFFVLIIKWPVAMAGWLNLILLLVLLGAKTPPFKVSHTREPFCLFTSWFEIVVSVLSFTNSLASRLYLGLLPFRDGDLVCLGLF